MEKTIHQNIKTRLSDAQRAEAVTLYERGEMKAPEIARRFGVGRDTIYRHLKAVGAVEGRLLPELLAPLRAKLDAKIRAECIAREEDRHRRFQIAVKKTQAIAHLMDALVCADREGTLPMLLRQHNHLRA